MHSIRADYWDLKEVDTLFSRDMASLHYLLVAILFGFSACGVIDQFVTDRELSAYRGRVRILYSMLEKQCPEWAGHAREKREVLNSHLQVEKMLYAELIEALNKCTEQKTTNSDKKAGQKVPPKTADKNAVKSPPTARKAKVCRPTIDHVAKSSLLCLWRMFTMSNQE